MNTYLVLLRGINVGGKNMIKMADLKTAITEGGFNSVRTFIQSGNVFVISEQNNPDLVAKQIEKVIKDSFGCDVGAVAFTKQEWKQIVESAPEWWGRDDAWKHNLLVLLKPYEMKEVVAAVGELKPEIEAMEPGEGVLYQSMSRELFGRTTTGKISSSPVYKQMTVRNYNTSTKLLTLFDD